MLNAAFSSYEILTTLAPQASSYLCIGVQEGECLMHVLRANPDIERVALCDTWGPHHGGTNRGNHNHITERLLNFGFKGAVQYLDGPSSKLIPTVTESFDLTYVDGAHDEASALVDLENVWPKTQQVMVVHDIAFPSVKNAFVTFLKKNPSRVMYCTGGTGTAVVYR